MKLVTAIWSAGYPVHYARENRELQPGDTAKVPQHEAEASTCWTVPEPAKSKPTAPAAAGEKE